MFKTKFNIITANAGHKIKNDLDKLLLDWKKSSCTAFNFRSLVPNVTKTWHHDQTSKFYEAKSHQRQYNTALFASFQGKQKRRNSRQRFILVPTVSYNLFTKQISLLRTRLTVEADAKKETMFDNYKRTLRKMKLSQRFESLNATF